VATSSSETESSGNESRRHDCSTRTSRGTRRRPFAGQNAAGRVTSANETANAGWLGNAGLRGHRVEVVDVMRQAAGDAVDDHRVSEAGEVGCD